jgi:hypothetical protein
MDAPLRNFLRSLPAVHALVLDLFFGHSMDVAAELGTPAYFFMASGASFLAVFLSLPGMEEKFFELGGDSIIRLPGVPPFKATDLVRTNKDFLRMAERISESNGILINTLESLEARAVRALRDGLCVPSHPTPPVYCIGPLVSEGGDKKQHECPEWLDAQPDNSVVFLSFGSMGTFQKKQLHEIAAGLEKSGQRFLWSFGAHLARIRSSVTNFPSQTSTRSCPKDSWKEQSTGGSLSIPGRRRWRCCATGQPARS